MYLPIFPLTFEKKSFRKNVYKVLKLLQNEFKFSDFDFNEHKVCTWVISSYDSYQSEGSDRIFLALLQKTLPVILKWLFIIFRSNLELLFIPRKWRDVRVC